MFAVYPACFYKEDNGCSVIFPDLNRLSTSGSNMNEAMKAAVDCLAGYLYMCLQDGEDIPVPTTVEDIDPVQVALELDPEDPAPEAFVSMVTVDVEAYAKEHFEKSVKKTLTIPAWLNKAALGKGINFSQTLQEALLAKVKSR